jgi:hypothetical protein
MKANLKSIFLVSMLLGATAMPAFSQISNNNEDEVYKVDQRYGHDFVPGQVLVKMKDGSPANVRRVQGRFQSAGVSRLDAVLHEFGVENMEQLLPHEKPGRALRRAKAFNGTIVQEKDLSQLYLVQMSEEKAMETHQLIERLTELPEVEYAEPNYKAYITADVNSFSLEPLFSQLWGLTAINMPSMWLAHKITQKRPVIALLDTGVDITHPDLADNIWTNTAEAEGEAGYDNDNNGFKNDIHGWDFINQTGNIRDFNGHGSHCAGIAAAIGDNSLGVVGANPDALIMPITIMQSDGTGDLATIIRGIDYAIDMKADILSMSIGTYATSTAFEEALGRAYQNAILVAAAGNDGLCLNHAHPERGQLSPKPMFPAAYAFVLGVQASAASGAMAGFSNYDDDGASFSAYSEDKLYNYELRAPGASIMSIWPGGRYRSLSGTSMACPLVAGALSRLIQCKEIGSKEELFGDLIHSKTLVGDLDIYKAYQMKNENRRPTIEFVTFTIDDSEGDGDGRPDAGETIDIYPTIRNSWGMATNIQLSIELGDLEDPDIVEFLDANVVFGSNLSGYAKNVTANPLRLKICDDCADGRHIKLVLKATCDNITNTMQQEIVLIAENGVELGGLITEDFTLTSGKNYIVSKNLGVPSGVTLTIEPGTVLKFKENIIFQCDGRLIAIGEPGNLIYFTRYENSKWGGITTGSDLSGNPNNNLVYCSINGFSHKYRSLPGFYNCIISSIDPHQGIGSNDRIFGDKNNIIESGLASGGKTYENIRNSNFINNDIYYDGIYWTELIHSNYLNNYRSGTQLTIIAATSSLGEVYNDTPSYLGTTNVDIANTYANDIDYNNGFCQINLSNMQTSPIAEAHGIVWKVVVNGYDAQDEFEQLPPLGVGRHKFEVYFNRPMNKAVTPQISFGVREPYTQQVVAEDGSWNEEGTVYTAYKTITGKTKSDGLNRIYVYGAEDDEFFEIPYEKTRFNINIQAAGSMATGFMAEAGLGKVSLTWNNDENNFDDAMGFNIYRYTEATIDNPTRINEDIVDIETTEYTDYDVTPGETYYYMYKVLSTDLQEYDVSNIVSVTPLTSTKGDANGSGDVDVADVVSTVNYVVGIEQKPFIFEAADMNNDLTIDVLDVIGIVQAVLHPSSSRAAIENVAEVVYTIEDGILYVESPVTLAGLQVQLSTNEDPVITDEMRSFELASAWLTDSDYLLLAYSFGAKTLEPGKHAVLKLGSGELKSLRLSDTQGRLVRAVPGEATVIKAPMGSRVMNTKGVYNLNGQKMTGNADTKLRKGVYIINGQKIVK